MCLAKVKLIITVLFFTHDLSLEFCPFRKAACPFQVYSSHVDQSFQHKLCGRFNGIHFPQQSSKERVSSGGQQVHPLPCNCSTIGQARESSRYNGLDFTLSKEKVTVPTDCFLFEGLHIQDSVSPQVVQQSLNCARAQWLWFSCKHLFVRAVQQELLESSREEFEAL
jgi:hypothetical protein